MVSGMKSSTTYPSFADMHVLAAADLLMRETMARYDVSHDAHHGLFLSLDQWYSSLIID